jgi:hypothetical protein
MSGLLRLLSVLLLLALPASAAEVTIAVKSGEVNSALESKKIVDYMTAHGISSDDAELPVDVASNLAHHEALAARIEDIGADPSGPAKSDAVSLVLAGDKIAALWVDTTWGDKCDNMVNCGSVGTQLCSVVGGTNIRVQINPGSRCTVTCQGPKIAARVKCP